MTPELTFYKLYDQENVIIRPGNSKREWMDNTSDKYAYRCIPLSMANASGWEVLLPFSFDVFWNGNNDTGAITIIEVDGENYTGISLDQIAISHFGHGILTFFVPYLVQTSPGWAAWVRGAPNFAKDRIVPLDGLVETDWLPFTFTMNWRFTEAGIVRFNKGDPYCFISLYPHAIVDNVQPVMRSIDDNPELKQQNQEWSKSRTDFIKNPNNTRKDWQKFYVRGQGPSDDVKAGEFHASKRRLKEVVIR